MPASELAKVCNYKPRSGGVKTASPSLRSTRNIPFRNQFVRCALPLTSSSADHYQRFWGWHLRMHNAFPDPKILLMNAEFYSEPELVSSVHFSLTGCQVLSGLYRSIASTVLREPGPKSAS